MRRLGPILVCLAVTGVVVGLGPRSATSPTPALAQEATADEEALVEEGRDLYLVSCVTCHGSEGQGQEDPDGDVLGPSLADAGAAGAYYQLTTGRMPLADPNDLPTRKEPAFSEPEIDALVAFVASLGDGPPIPDVDVARGDLAEGGVLYRESCQACHSATGAGGALSYGRAAPPLAVATPTQVGSAVRSGPGPMPRFGPEVISAEDLDSIAGYVQYLEDPDDAGGLALGRLGPIPEGFMIWVGGLGTLLVLAFWMGKRLSAMPRVDPIPPGAAPVGAARSDDEDSDEDGDEGEGA